MKQSELTAAFNVAKAALKNISYMGVSASSLVSDQQLSDLVQDCLQAAEDVRKGIKPPDAAV